MNQKTKNLLNLDINEIEPKPLLTDQKMNIKNHVLSRSKIKKRFNVRYLAVAAVLGISVLTTSFMAPAIANQIPFIQSILTYFEDDALPNTYSDFATVVNQVQSSNGIDVMIENAVYDGTNIILTYAIKTEKDLGYNPKSDGFLELEPATGIGGTGSIEKIYENTYVGIEKVTPHFKGESPKEILIQWQPKTFMNLQTNKKFVGDWNFEFTLAQLPTYVQQLNQTMEQDGLTIELKSLERSEMAAVLQYEFYVESSILQDWPFVSIEMAEVKDNLGNIYEINGNGGVSQNKGAKNQWRATIYSLDPNATSLTLLPAVYYSKGSGVGLGPTNMKPIIIDLD